MALNVGLATGVSSADGAVATVSVATAQPFLLAVLVSPSLPEWAAVTAPIVTTTLAPTTADSTLKLPRTRWKFISSNILSLDVSVHAQLCERHATQRGGHER